MDGVAVCSVPVRAYEETPYGVTTNGYFHLQRRWGRRWLPWQSVQTVVAGGSVKTATCWGVSIFSLV